MGFCNSCGKPIVKEDYGTNEDGSLNPEFCKDCFQDGKYTEPDITLTEMIVRKSKEMMEKNPRLPHSYLDLKDGILNSRMIINFKLHYLK